MHANRIGAGGRITIPAEFRKKLRLRPGTPISWRETNGRLELVAFKRLLKEMQGAMKPRPGEPSAFEMLSEERKREKMREDSRGNPVSLATSH